MQSFTPSYTSFQSKRVFAVVHIREGAQYSYSKYQDVPQISGSISDGCKIKTVTKTQSAFGVSFIAPELNAQSQSKSKTCAYPFRFFLTGVNAWIKVNLLSLKDSQFRGSQYTHPMDEYHVTWSTTSCQELKSFPHLTLILVHAGVSSLLFPSLTLRRCKQHHCRHMAPRSQKTVWRL